MARGNMRLALVLSDSEQLLKDVAGSYPDAKRALLTAYADTDAAIQAINSVQIDHYFMKPWDPPEDRLYGVLDDLLDADPTSTEWASAPRIATAAVRCLHA